MKNSVADNKVVSCEVKRTQRMTCFLSDEEIAFIDSYLKKNKVSNKSRWIRETLMSFIHKDMDDNYPMLFDEHEMRR